MNKQQNMKKIQEYFDYLLDNSTWEKPMWNIEHIMSGKPNKWNYIDGCMITAVLAMYKITGNIKYLNFADNFMSGFVKENEILTYDIKEYNLDNINPAKNLFELYNYTKKEKYLNAIKLVRSQLDTMPRIKQGNFWHKKIYPNQVWLDGLYMAQPFYMQYETQLNDKKGCLDSFKQFCVVRNRMRDEKTGLYYHGYDESCQMYWADKKTGCSPNFWLRAVGWFTIALVDTIEVMDEQMYYEYRTLRNQLRELINDLLKYQAEYGMFYQIIDKADEPKNYKETSGTAIIAYGILKAVRLGILSEEYAKYGEKAFWGIVERYLKFDNDGKPILGGICLVAGLGGNNHRDGSLEYYFSEKVVENEAKGVAPFILAFTELLAREKEI